MIKTRGLTKAYGNKKVVDDISITIPKNKLIAFVGSNGAGKSTLLSLIGRTLDRSSGECHIDEKEVKEWNSRELAKRLSILSQTNHLNIRLTVHELVQFGRFPYSQGRLTKEDEKKVAEAISYMSIDAFKDRYLDELSGGQRQMAYIAMLIAQDTKYVFLDEPLNNLDMKHSVQIMKILTKMVKELGKTVMVVIHDINFVSCYADYIIAMKDGKIIANGPSEEVMNSQMLQEVFGMEIKVEQIEGNKICLYYT
ncbi:iron ABC transporter ATP-binding protein [Lachnoclostridium phytofermentans]|uniref:ABC transporter related n=1 Tax=Lachnoclostridium phytofermentans (strain ATCC 700394 / DSM 18823 / ISDg) TaxID=357809 RepID=A9KJW5_LACP7|nr:ATP-binding cassette domain-containing protein [Lachnoclostridium phytofermentans]ABX41120.1 ABC transporter related [Lachnoclostridium phytofermentans ISDg]